MNEKVKILFFCMIFVGGSAFAQKSASFIAINKAYFVALKKQSSSWIKHTATIKTTATVLSTNQLTAYSIISSNFYTQNFGFFCKKELQLEKAIKLPLKFRLGSVQQCDWMEGKPNAGIR